MKIKILNIIVSKISLISYQFFLLQHLIIYKIIYYFPEASSNIAYFCILFLCIITTIFFSFLLYWLSNKLIQTKMFKDLENWILNNNLSNNLSKKFDK